MHGMYIRLFVRENAPVDPVREVKRPVGSQSCQIVGRDSLRFTCPLQHEQLRQYRHCFYENRERPEDLGEGERVVEDERQEDTWTDEVFDLEGVDGGVLCWSELELHEV